MPTLSLEAAIMVWVNIRSIILCFVTFTKTFLEIAAFQGSKVFFPRYLSASREMRQSDIVPAERT